MNNRRLGRPPVDGRVNRRNRDRLDSTDGIEAVLEKGHAWLRFPEPLEALFQAETLQFRRKLLMICGALGILSIYLGTRDIAKLNPDIVDTALRVAHINIAAGAFGLFLLLLIPRRWQRNWQAEAATALVAVGTCLGLINGCLLSRADTTFTHSATMVTVVMYACIAARQRFRWALGCAVLSFLAYVLFVKGFTSQQQLIVITNIKLMVLSFAFALVANYTFEYRDRRTWLLRKLEERRRQALVETQMHLQRLSMQDPLTGLINRRQFDRELAQAWSHAAQAGEPLAMLMVDVDFFKRYNDTYGHPAGDACLVRVSQMLDAIAKENGGVAARLGGEEFGLLMPACTQDQARQVGVALCERVRMANIAHEASGVAPHVTVSIGAAQAWPDNDLAPPSLVLQADQALYLAKQGGRDQVCAAKLPGPGFASKPSPAQVGSFPTLAGQSMATDADPAVPVESSQGSTYAQTLQSQFRWLRFPEQQEAQYQRDHAAQRRLLLLVMSILGMGLYQVYLLSSRAMFADIPDRVLIVQWEFSACALILAIVSYKLPVISSWWREALFSVTTAVMAVVTLWVLSHSQLMTALSFAASLALVPLFVGAGARQPFWFTCLPGAVTCLAAAWMLKPMGQQQTLVYQDSMLMIINNAIFALMLAYTLEHGARKGWLLSNIEQLDKQGLLEATRRLHTLTMQDPLTGIFNRRQFDVELAKLWDEALRKKQSLAMLIIDVDFFKLYNDGYGHPAGDLCLKQVAKIISEVAQAQGASAARLGGEEFGVLLPGGDTEKILGLGEQVCEAVRRANIEHGHSKVPGYRIVTASIGAASLLPAKSDDQSTLMAMADDALYQAKNLGRNRVEASRVPQPAMV